MSLTVKHLKKALEHMRDDAIVVNSQNQDFIYMAADDRFMLSTDAPIGTCNRTGCVVFPSKVNGYSAFSPELDEDLYSMEWIKDL